MYRGLILLSLISLYCVALFGQSKEVGKKSPAGLLSAQDLKQVMPASVFFAGQTAPVQLRNSGGLRTSTGKLVLIGMVDSSGYSSGVAQKYQAYLITETGLHIEGKSLPPGAYGVGFLDDATFNVMDLGGHDLTSVPGHSDAGLHRAVPLRLASNTPGKYRLYFGKRYVDFSGE